MLNSLFRIGTARTASLQIEPRLTTIAETFGFFERMGATWGARRHVVQRVESATSELLETVIGFVLAEGMIDIHVRFDEYRLGVTVLYSGLPLPTAEGCPTPDEMLADDKAMIRLSCSLIRQYADRVVFGTERGQQCISLHFDH